MRIAVIGTGYVGLVSGACFADMGNKVVCVDCDAQKVALLHQGEIPIHEPGLDKIVARALRDYLILMYYLHCCILVGVITLWLVG